MSTAKLPHGMHKYYASDKFTDSAFWFMCGMVYGCNRLIPESANAFREFLGLDEDVAPTETLIMKFHRQRKNFREVIVVDRDKINLSDDEFMKEITDEVLRRLKAKGNTAGS